MPWAVAPAVHYVCLVEGIAMAFGATGERGTGIAQDLNYRTWGLLVQLRLYRLAV